MKFIKLTRMVNKKKKTIFVNVHNVTMFGDVVASGSEDKSWVSFSGGDNDHEEYFLETIEEISVLISEAKSS